MAAALSPDYKETADDKAVKDVEWTLVSIDLYRFLSKWAKLVVPPTMTAPGGVFPFELWPHLLRGIEALLTKDKISVLKSRQVGWSWLIAAYVLWYALTKPHSIILLFSAGEKEAIRLLDKCHQIWQHLPSFMRFPLGQDATTLMTFLDNGSRIQAFASTEGAGVGETASLVVFDEHILHPYAATNFDTVKPTTDAGAQTVSIFTIKKDKFRALAVQLFKGALEGVNGFTPLFVSWKERPGRTVEWYAQTKKALTSTELEGLSPELYMESNYPGSIEEALRPSQTLSAFDHSVLDQMAGDCKNPVHITADGVDPNICHVYKEYAHGHIYVAATDTAHGVGQDYSVTVVLDLRTGAVVADILNNTIAPEELALWSVRLLALYHNPRWYIESNDWGGVTISEAQKQGYRNFGYVDDKKKNHIGFDTKGPSRNALWGALIPAVNNGQCTIYNKDGLMQFQDIIRNASKEGRIEAMSGRHDDYPMAVGIAWLKGEIAVVEGKLNPPVEYPVIYSLDFRKEPTLPWRSK